MANYITVDASAAGAGVNYAEFIASFFANQGTKAADSRAGDVMYYDSTYFSPFGYYDAAQVGIRYQESTDKGQVLIEGENMQYDGIVGQHGSYSGSVDSVSFGHFTDDTTYAQIDNVARSTLIGSDQEVTISGLDIFAAVGAGVGSDNIYYKLLQALQNGNSTVVADGATETNGALAIDALYAMFASKAQHFIGSDGDDTYVGTKFADKIDGGAGFDTLSGGNGKDVFVFDLGDSAATVEDADIILDFQAKKDKIDLSIIDTNADKNGDQAFKFFGTGDLGSKPGVAWEKVGTETHVSIDTNGDATADMLIILEGNFKLTADHFIL